MSIGGVGSGTGIDTAALERQLQADVKALQDAEKAKAAQAVIDFGFRKLKVHRSMKDISDLIYETCKTYLLTQG